MRALYFGGRPMDIGLQKNFGPQHTTIVGAKVYHSEVLTALFRYGSFDQFYLPEIPSNEKKDVLALPEIQSNLDRIQFLPEHSLYVLRKPETLYFMSPGIGIRFLARMRDKVGRIDAPITGVLHSLNYSLFTEQLLLEMLSPLTHSDAFFASSTAAIEAIRKQIDFVLRQPRNIFSQLGLRFQPRFINVPLGVFPELYERKDVEEIKGLRNSLNIDQEAVVLLYFGRMSANSKADLLPLILAFSQLPYVSARIFLLLAGDDTQLRISGELREFAGALGCHPYVRVIPDPTQSDKYNLFKLADIFVSPSDSIQETFGITLIEAMAASLPVIASDWDGYRDIVVHGKTGFLVPTAFPAYPVDFDLLHSSGHMVSDDLLARTTVVSIPHLIDSMLELCSNPHIRREFGRSGRMRVMRIFDWKQVVRQYELTWDGLAKEARNYQPNPSATEQRLEDVYSYKEIFGHFATGYLRLDDIVEPGIDTFQGSQRAALLNQIAMPKDRFDPAIFESILAQVTLFSPLEIEQITCVEHDTSSLELTPLDDEAITLAHLARLIKYGLLRLRHRA